MTPIGPLHQLPIACTLAPNAGNAQLVKWRAFDADYALGRERTERVLTIRYAKVEDSIARLRDLVAIESACCSFVDWQIDTGHSDLRLIVTGTPEQLAALTISD